MKKTFEITDMCLLHYFLCVEVQQTLANAFIYQSKYAREVFLLFQMQVCKPSPTPRDVGVNLSSYNDEDLVDPTLYE
jgi:hypothetical protein